ncbi:unnamed protein product, partial [Brassica oleracea]
CLDLFITDRPPIQRQEMKKPSSRELLNQFQMATYKLLLISFILIFLSRHVLSDIDEEDVLFIGINSYRASQNLTTLNNNENAECLADEIADQLIRDIYPTWKLIINPNLTQLKNKPCTNDTGSATVPGTEPQFADYPNILAKCHLSVSDTRDGLIMPACVPFLESSPSLVLTNFTKSQYSLSLNDSKFTGMGIGKEDDWIVVVLTTNTPQGSFSTATKVDLMASLLLLASLTMCLFSSCPFVSFF